MTPYGTPFFSVKTRVRLLVRVGHGFQKGEQFQELEEKISELGEKESKEREALKEEFSARLDQRVGDLTSEVKSSRVGDL